MDLLTPWGHKKMFSQLSAFCVVFCVCVCVCVTDSQTCPFSLPRSLLCPPGNQKNNGLSTAPLWKWTRNPDRLVFSTLTVMINLSVSGTIWRFKTQGWGHFAGEYLFISFNGIELRNTVGLFTFGFRAQKKKVCDPFTITRTSGPKNSNFHLSHSCRLIKGNDSSSFFIFIEYVGCSLSI